MNKIQRINSYYAVAKGLLNMYLALSEFDNDARKLMELSKLYIDKAQTLKAEFDEKNPEFDEEIDELERAIETKKIKK